MSRANAFSRVKWVAALGLMVVLAAVAGWIHVGGPAVVTGETADERITSICRIADEKPWGAPDAIAGAAAHPEPSVRIAAQVALGRFVDQDYRQTVEAGLEDSDAGVRSAAAATLGYYADEASADRLNKIVTDDPHQKARLGAVVGLARNTAPKAVIYLLETAEHGTDAEVQYQAIKELYRRFGMRYIGPRPDDPATWKDLIEWLKSFRQVQEAYKLASRPLHRHPEHLRGHARDHTP